MPGANTSLKASASFSVRPARSQVVLVGLTVAAIVSFLLSGVLLALDKESGWAFFSAAVLLCLSVVWCWTRAHRDTDLAQSHPTKVVLADGANLSTDSRLLSSPEGVRNMAHVLEALALRHPLPEPAGLVGQDATLVPNSKGEALAMVNRINAETQRMHDEALQSLRGQLSGDHVSQPSVDASALPPTLGTESGARNTVSEPSEQPSSQGTGAA